MNQEATNEIQAREKQGMIKEISEHLSQISRIGNPTILIEKTKLIIHITKQLLEGFDELTISKTSNCLTMLVSNTKIIAADPTAVTPESIKSLSRSRDKLLTQLSEINSALEQSLAGQVYDSLYRAADVSDQGEQDKEREQLEHLAKQREELRGKKSVQQAFILEGDPATMLEEVVSEFLSSTKSLEESYAPGNNPSRSEILLSLCGISSSVLRLLDLIDSLFVSKFPMRKQVYTFTEKLVELGMAYKPVERRGGREGEAISDMRKQLPALQNSAKVMLDQLEERVKNLTASRQKSMKRRQDLSLIGSTEIDKAVSDVVNSAQKEDKSTRCLHLRLICHVCCTSAKQAINGEPIKRGSVLRLEVSGDASIRELKEQLSRYTGIPVKYVLPRFPGVNQPANNEVELGELFEGGDMRDVFLFDLSSSEGQNEDELRELRRLAVAQMSIDDYNWEGEWSGDIAQATVDYDVTEPGHLSFIEGELVRVLERSADGWWRGEVNGVQGVFYKTFVQELHRDTGSSVPTNFKQVKFSVKKKESYLTRKKSDEEPIIPPPPGKKSSSRYLPQQEGAPLTSEQKKKASHFSIELDESLETESSFKSEAEHDNSDSTASDSVASVAIRDIQNSCEKKTSGRINSIDIDDMLEQLSEYSGIPVPETPDELPPTLAPVPYPAPTVPSIANLGFATDSPEESPLNNFSQNKSTLYATSSTNSAVNPLFSKTSECGGVYDSLLGVEESSNLGFGSGDESETEDNPLYEKVESAPDKVPVEKQKEDPTRLMGAASSHEHSGSKSPSYDPPPLPTSTRPPKMSPLPLDPPSSTSILTPKPKSKPILGKKGKVSNKPDKDKPKPEKKKRNFFGKKTKSMETSVITEDSPLPPIPPPENNSSSNNSNPNPIIEDTFTPQQRHSVDTDYMYEQVEAVKGKTQGNTEGFSKSLPQQTIVSPRRSHYEQVDLMFTPPSKPKLDKVLTVVEDNPDQDIGPQIVVGDHMYSQVDVKEKTKSIVERQKLTLSVDELPLGSGRDASVENSLTQSLPASEGEGQLSPGPKSYPIYSQITRKRDSIIIQDEGDDTPVAVNVSPGREVGNAVDPKEFPQKETDHAAKSRPILPPKTLSIEDVEVYINSKNDKGVDPPLDTVPPSPDPSPKKRFSHYQEITPQESSPVTPPRTLTRDEVYEEVVDPRPRSQSTPQRKGVEPRVKTPLETSLSASFAPRVLIPAKDNELPDIPTTEPDIDAYESIDSVLGASAKSNGNKSPEPNTNAVPPVDIRTMYRETLLVCISNLIQLKTVNCSLFTKDNSQTKKLLKQIESGQPVNVDYKTPPSILASLIRQILKPEKIGPLFPAEFTELMLQLVKNDKVFSISGFINSTFRDLSKFIRDFIYFLYLNINDLNEKKKQEFIVCLSPLFFEDTTKKNMDTCKHILRYLVEHYSTIFQN